MKGESSKPNNTMIWMLVLSVFGATTNTLLYKASLNAFSSPTTNYGFFVSQFSILLYLGQAALFSLFVIWKHPETLTELYQVPHSIFIYMGALDSGSSTIGAIAGAFCPGEIQTILNQMVIPLTMMSAYLFLGTTFESYQLWGSGLILFGAITASSDYLFNPSAGTTTSGHGMMMSVSIALYFISVIPSALSNIYKEDKMKEKDLNEVHTSTIVSFWQLWVGFIFLPLLKLPALGGLSYKEMSSQLADGYSCFLGTNPNDPNDDCSNSATIFLAYVIVNFFYNVLLLAITKRGSAVLLVISQALSLPLTNIAFTLRPLMGNDAEPFTMLDLVGLVFVIIGFLAYSGFGFASNFMVVQGPPGQMAYAHFEDIDEVVISTRIGSRPEELADFVLGSVVQSHIVEVRKKKHLKGHSKSNPELTALTHADEIESGHGDLEELQDLTPIEVHTRALNILRNTVLLLEKNQAALQRGVEMTHLHTPEIMKRYGSTASPRINQREKSIRPKSLAIFTHSTTTTLPFRALVEMRNYSTLEEEEGDASQKFHPETKTCLFSRIFVNWLTPVINLAYERPLQEEDLWDPPAFCEISTHSHRLHTEWKKQCEKNPSKPSLLHALFDVFREDIIRSGLFQFLFMCLQLIQPFLIENLLDEISSPKSTLRSGFFAASSLALVAFLSSAALISAFYQSRRTALLIRGAMMMNVYSHALLLTSTSRQQNNIGTTANLMSIDSEKLVLAYLFLHFLWQGPLTVLIVMAILVTQVGALTAFIGVVFLLIVFPIQKKLALMIGGYRRETIKETDQRVNLINEALQAIRAIKLYSWEESIQSRVMEIRTREVSRLSKYLSANAFLRDINYVNPAVTALIIFVVYRFLASHDPSTSDSQLSTGKVLTVLAYLNICRFPLNLLSQAMKATADANVSLTRLGDFFLLPTLTLREVANEPASISLTHATFSWRPKSDSEVLSPLLKKMAPSSPHSNFTLQDLSLSLHEGELVGVIGTVGSGKSTFASALLGEIPLLGGSMKVQGSIAYSAQTPWIQNMSLKENILFCADRDDPNLEAIYLRALDQAALLPDLAILPAGDLTEIGERGINLSGGQKARVALCRVLVASSHADIIILDDPFSAVDGATGNWMFNKGILQGLAGKIRIVILNSHLHLLSHFQKIILLDEGKPVVIGSPSEILSSELYNNVAGSIGKRNLNSEADSQSHPRQEFNSPTTLSPIASGNGKLTLKENRAVGGITFQSYTAYFGAAFWNLSDFQSPFLKTMSWSGLTVVSVILFGFLISQFIRVCVDIELLNWASKGGWDIHSPYFFGYLLLIAVLCLLVEFRTRVQTYFATQTSLNIHSMMLQKILNAPIPLYFDVQTIGSILNKFGKDLETIDVNIPEFFYQTCLQFFVLFSVVILCLWSMPLIIIFLCPLFCCLIYIARKYSYISRDLKRLESISRTPIYSSFSETLSGIETIRAFGAVSKFYRRHLVNMNRYQKFAFHATMSQLWLTTRMEFGGCLILIGACFLAILAKSKFTVEPMKIGLALVYSLQITAMLQRNVQLLIELQTYFTSVERVLEYADIPQEEILDKKCNELLEGSDEELGEFKMNQLWPRQGSIEFRNVWMKYRPNTPVILQGISFLVHGGERIGICGRTGSGKSSIIQSLFRIVEIFEGEIFVDNVNIQKVSLHKLRSNLAIIPQDPIIFCGDLRYQLDPFGEYNDEQIWQVLEMTNMAQTVKGMPLGLKEPIAHNGENLSQGQRQLLCIARALLKQAQILVLDEATSAVDQQTDDFIQQVLREEARQRGMTVLTIAHRLHTIVDFDKILVLDQGTICEFDTPQNLLGDKDSEFSKMLRDYNSLHSISSSP